jgi:hypothetical protein
MKLNITILATIVFFSLAGFAAETEQGAIPQKPACCLKAEAKGKQCKKACCQAAAKEGKICERCLKKEQRKKDKNAEKPAEPAQQPQ